MNDLEKAELFSLVLRATTALHKEHGATPGPSHTDVPTVATINFLDFWNAVKLLGGVSIHFVSALLIGHKREKAASS